MKTRAAVLRKAGTPWEITELELDAPQANEVLIRMAAAGLCHSDEQGRRRHERRPGRQVRRRQARLRDRPQPVEAAAGPRLRRHPRVRRPGQGQEVLIDLTRGQLTELITKKYALDEINDGYQDLMNGKNIRGVVVHAHS